MVHTRAVVLLMSLPALFLLSVCSFPSSAFACDFGSAVGGGSCRGYLTSGTTWTVPSDWNTASNTIEVIGGGGGGQTGGTVSVGGGGGAYAESTNVSLTKELP
jgi:hypothetical protein